MFIRLHKQKQRGKVYTSVQICESYRDPDKGGAPRNRVVVNLGPLDKLGADTLKKLGDGFLRAAGGSPSQASEPRLLAAVDFGHVFAAGGVWDHLGLSAALNRAGLAGAASFPACDLIRLLVVNRVCDPCSKLALLNWLDSVHYSEDEKPSYHHLLRAMDRLGQIKDRAEPLIAGRLLAEDEPLDLVFYDITSTYFEGDRSLVEDDVRQYGYSRDHRPDRRQVVIGMVTTRTGIPLCHHVFSGNTVDKATVSGVVRDLNKRFKLKRIVFVGDRGMLSDPNLETLLQERLGFIVAHPLRRNHKAKEVIEALAKEFDRTSGEEQFAAEERDGVRFVLAWSPEIARQSRQRRDERLKAADAWIKARLKKLAHPASRGRKPTVQGTYDAIRDHLRNRNLLGCYDLNRDGGAVTALKNMSALAWERKIDGMLMLETTDKDLPLEEVVRRYKDLAEIERGWRSLKSTLLIRPVHHWTEKRIRAHIFICVLALQIERWMRLRLEMVSAPRALSQLQRIKVGELEIDGKKSRVVTRPTSEQKQWLKAIGAPPIPASLP